MNSRLSPQVDDTNARKGALAAAYVRGLQTVVQEVQEHGVVAHTGEVPRELAGALFRNGGGKHESFGTPYAHPFDGDGMITRFSFDEGRVLYTNRYVRTEEYQREAQAQKMLYRGFGTNVPGGLWRNALRLRFKNAANTSVMAHQGKLLALWEGGQPHELDAETLETHGRFTFDDTLVNPFGALAKFLAPELPFSAHPKVCPQTGELWNFGTLYGAPNRLLVYKRRPHDNVLERRAIALPSLTFIHDFALTSRYCVFFLSPVSFALGKSLLGLSAPADSLQFSDGPVRVLLVPRDGGEPRAFDVPSCFVFHFVNAFEEGDLVHVDALRMDRYPVVARAKTVQSGEADARPEAIRRLLELDYPAPRLTRFSLNLQTGDATTTQQNSIPCELPTVAPEDVTRCHSASYAICAEAPELSPFFTSIVHFDGEGNTVAKHDFGDRFPSEPLLIGHPGSRVLTSLVYDPKEHVSNLVLLEPSTLACVAELALPHHIPPGFHGTWIERS